MHFDLLHHFGTPAYRCYDTCLVETDGRLGVLYMGVSGNNPEQEGLSLTLINLLNRENQTITYSGYSPGKFFAMDALLRYDEQQQRWLMFQLHNSTVVGLRTLRELPDRNVQLSPLCLLENDNSERSLYPLLGVCIYPETYALFLHQPVIEHMNAPRIHRIDLTLNNVLWDTLSEPAVVITKGPASSTPTVAIPQEGAVVLPEGTYFDPIDPTLHYSQAALIVNNVELAEAENAMILRDERMQVMVTFSPETWAKPKISPRQWPGYDEQWRFWIMSWNKEWSQYRWIYASEVQLPVEPFLSHEYPAWQDVEVAVVQGPVWPPQQEKSVVAVLAVLDKEHDRVLAEGVCLDQDGQVVQRCSSPLGRYPFLAASGEMIVGVDCLQGQWRLWTWPVLKEAILQTVVSLDAACQQAFVYESGDGQQVWVVEELPQMVRVSLRDAETLAEVTPAATLSGVQLLDVLRDDRMLNGYYAVGLVPYLQSLLLVLKDDQNELVLYRVV